MDMQQLAPLTLALGKANLVAGTTSTITTTGTLAYAIAGKAYSRSALTNQATPTVDFATGAAFTGITANQGTIVLIGLDASGAVRAVQGGVAALDVSGADVDLQGATLPARTGVMLAAGLRLATGAVIRSATAELTAIGRELVFGPSIDPSGHRIVIDTGRAQVGDLRGQLGECLLGIGDALLPCHEDLLSLDGDAESVADAVAPHGGRDVVGDFESHPAIDFPAPAATGVVGPLLKTARRSIGSARSPAGPRGRHSLRRDRRRSSTG